MSKTETKTCWKLKSKLKPKPMFILYPILENISAWGSSVQLLAEVHNYPTRDGNAKLLVQKYDIGPPPPPNIAPVCGI